MNGLIDFMNTTLGRGLRAVLGMALIYIGLVMVGGPLGWVVAVVGILPIAMGAWGHCALELALPKARHA